jgi:glycosyltransferase involved in cell wall biosynthesis
MPGIRYIPKANGGVSSARNYGASISTAEWICFLDQDDLLLPDHLTQIAEAIGKDNGADLFYAPRLVLSCHDGVWSTSTALPPPTPKDLGKVLSLRCPFPPSGICVRKSAFEKVGGFHSRYDLAEDWEFWLRLHTVGTNFHLLDRPTICYRVHMESNSHRPLPILHANVRVIRERIMPSMMFLQRISTGQQLISRQEADAAILLRQMGQDGGPSLLLRSICRFPLGNWRRYKIAAHMSTQILKHVFTRDPAGSRA